MNTAQSSHEPDPVVAEARQQIAANVRAEMGRHNTTQTALANYLGMSQPVVSRRVRGEHPFDTDELVAVAQFLNCDLGKLLEGVRSRCFSPLTQVQAPDGQMELPLGDAPTLVLVGV